MNSTERKIVTRFLLFRLVRYLPHLRLGSRQGPVAHHYGQKKLALSGRPGSPWASSHTRGNPLASSVAEELLAHALVQVHLVEVAWRARNLLTDDLEPASTLHRNAAIVAGGVQRHRHVGVAVPVVLAAQGVEVADGRHSLIRPLRSRCVHVGVRPPPGPTCQSGVMWCEFPSMTMLA